MGMRTAQPIQLSGEQRAGCDTRNSADSIYQGGGSQLTLSPSKSADGYAAAFNIGPSRSDAKTGQSDSQQGGGGPGRTGGPPPATP